MASEIDLRGRSNCVSVRLRAAVLLTWLQWAERVDRVWCAARACGGLAVESRSSSPELQKS